MGGPQGLDGVSLVPFSWDCCLCGGVLHKRHPIACNLTVLGWGQSQQGLGAYLFVLRGFGSWPLVWRRRPGCCGQQTRQPQGRGWRFLTPSTPSQSWLDCPTLAGCRPPISVGHQGNRATLGPEPGDAQPRLGLGDGGGSLKGLL